MQVRPWWQSGSMLPGPIGVTLSYLPGGYQDAAREDQAPPGNLFGGVGLAALSEPGLMVPTDSGLYVLPQPNQMPDLASVIRNILLGR